MIPAIRLSVFSLMIMGMVVLISCKSKQQESIKDVEPKNSTTTIEGGRLGSSLDSCIKKFGDSVASQAVISDDGRTLSGHIFRTSAYTLNCLFINDVLSRIEYTKGNKILGTDEITYEEIRVIVKMHIIDGEWINLSEDGDEFMSFKNKIDGYLGGYGDLGKGGIFKDLRLFVSDTKNGAIAADSEFRKKADWDNKKRLLDEL